MKVLKLGGDLFHTASPYDDGDQPGCTHRCDKCGQLRFVREPTMTKPHWCRRCRYEHWDEYFGVWRNQ